MSDSIHSVQMQGLIFRIRAVTGPCVMSWCAVSVADWRR